MVEETWWQECEVVDSSTSSVRKQKAVDAHFLILMQSKAPAHEMHLPIFKVSHSASIDEIQTVLH